MADAAADDGADHDVAHLTREPVPYDPTKPIDLGGVDGVTPEQQAAAENLVAITLIRLPQWTDPAVAEASGFRSIGDGLTGVEHFVNPAFMEDDVILDPDRPESLVYDTTGGGRRLVAAMYMVARGTPLDAVPDVGGALMQWHTHENLCYSPEGKVAGITDANGDCPARSHQAGTDPDDPRLDRAAPLRPVRGAGRHRRRDDRRGRNRPLRSRPRFVIERRPVPGDRFRRSRLIVFAGVVAALIAPVLWAVVAHPGASVGDIALIELRTRDVLSAHPPLVGAYSRYGWAHPGPLFFYLFSVPYRVLGRDADALRLSALLLNTATLSAMAWVVRRRGAAAFFLLMASTCALAWGLPPMALTDSWNVTDRAPAVHAHDRRLLVRAVRRPMGVVGRRRGVLVRVPDPHRLRGGARAAVPRHGRCAHGQGSPP